MEPFHRLELRVPLISIVITRLGHFEIIHRISDPIDAELGLHAIGTNSRRVSVVPFGLHPLGLRATVRYRVPRHIVLDCIGRRTGQFAVSSVDIWVEACGRFAHSWSGYFLEVRIFLCVKG